MLKKLQFSIVVISLIMAFAVPATATRPDRSHLQIEGGLTLYCDYDSDADTDWDYIVQGQFWQEVQNFYFYDQAGNLVKIKSNLVWHNQMTDPETGKAFTERAAGSDEYDPRNLPVVTEARSGNMGHLFVPGSTVDVRYQTAGRIMIKWFVGDLNDPSTWVPLEVLHQSGISQFVSGVDVCSLFREGHFVGVEPLPIVIKQLQ